MTDTAGPFDGAPWAEAQWARHASAWAPSGVYGTPAASTTTGDLPLSVSGLSVGVGTGRAWVRGFGFERTGGAVMQAVTANSHASFSRRDRIVLRRNLATHTVTPVLITGTPASTPAAPDLTQSDTGSWDLPLFSFLVPPNSGTAITSVVDERVWVPDDGGSLMVATMANRPTVGNSAGRTIRPLDRPQVQYTWDGTRWVQDGVPAAIAAAAPAGSYVSRYEDSITTTVTGGNGPGAYGVALSRPFSAAPLWSKQAIGTYSFTSLATLAVPLLNFTSSTVLVGFALRADGSTVPNGQTVTISYEVIGYNT